MVTSFGNASSGIRISAGFPSLLLTGGERREGFQSGEWRRSCYVCHKPMRARKSEQRSAYSMSRAACAG
jgi:hypothetical protein